MAKKNLSALLAATLALALSPILLAVACSGPLITPPAGPGTDLPCGYNGHSCGTQPDCSRTCCDNGSDCGGAVASCPAGMCCWHGNDDAFAARPPVAQRAEK